jgi:hypothetical protein
VYVSKHCQRACANHVRRTKSEQQQEQQQRVKREREDSVATAVGDEDEEVQYLDTRLAKRQRRSLGEADEVVDVEG